MSVYKAAIIYSVPESTLRDRTREKIPLDAHVGYSTIFTANEEKALVDHIKYMGDIGYGYNKVAIQSLATDYAVSLGKSSKGKDSGSLLSNCWFYGFLGRWQDLKVSKPQSLEMKRAESASRENLNKYYKELHAILTKSNLHDKPQNIYNIDETGFSTEHSPLKIICNRNTKPQAVTSNRSTLTTVIAAGNALGNYVPPYYVFKGKRWNPDFMKNAAPGAEGEMSETGWSNSQVFQNYLTKFFIKHIRSSEQPTLVLYDGHKSHVNLILTEWAKRHNIILFVLPPHTSHLTQPLDVGVFGPMKGMYNKECQLYMQKNPGIHITKYQIAELTARPYMRAMSPENLTSAFRKTGIHPINKDMIADSDIAPSLIYNQHDVTHQSSSHPPTASSTKPHSQNEEGEDSENSKNSTFFASRTITSVIQKPKKRFVPPFLSGSLSKKTNVNILKSIDAKQQKKVPVSSAAAESSKPAKRPKKEKITEKEEGPSTSGINRKGGPIPLLSEDEWPETSDGDSIADEEKCCMCHDWQPKELQNCTSVVFVKWGKCDFCDHWTHLQYCTPVRVLRRGDTFKCPHCENN